MDLQHYRATWHDYRAPGFYMLTMTADTQQHTGRHKDLFGTICGEDEASVHIQHTTLGKSIIAAIYNLEAMFPEVEVIESIVMPDHLHLQLWVHESMHKHLGSIVGYIKKVSTTTYLHEATLRTRHLCVTCQSDPREQKRQAKRIQDAIAWATAMTAKPSETIPLSPNESTPSTQVSALPTNERTLTSHISTTSPKERTTSVKVCMPSPSHQPMTGLQSDALYVLSHLVRDGSAVTQPIPILELPTLWTPGYHDRIVKHRGQISTQRRYILDNPRRAWIKSHTPNAFKHHGHIKYPIPLPLAQQLKQSAIWWDERRSVQHSPFTQRSHYADSYIELLAKFLLCKRSDKTPYLHLKAYGNLSLLQSGRPLINVRISRSIAGDALKSELSRLLRLCEEEGAVLISPFISPGENEIKLAAKLHGYPLIELCSKSMSNKWHPMQSNPKDAIFISQHILLNIPDDDSYTSSGRMLTLSPWSDRPEGEKAIKPDMELANEICSVMSIISMDENVC